MTQVGAENRSISRGSGVNERLMLGEDSTVLKPMTNYDCSGSPPHAVF